jgi:hypothetical protein
MLPSAVFLKSIMKAGSSNVGMPEAMLEWAELSGEETIGIKNAIGPLCVSTLDPDIVEYVCHTNAKNYRLRMLPDAFRYVIKNKGITVGGCTSRVHTRLYYLCPGWGHGLQSRLSTHTKDLRIAFESARLVSTLQP